MALSLMPPSSIALLTPRGRVRVGPAAPPPPASRVRGASSSRRRNGGRRRGLAVVAATEGGQKEEEEGATAAAGRMNLNEYMVAVDRPLGLRFALAVDGRIFVHSLKRGGNAEKSRIIMVGDTLKKAGTDHNEGLVRIKDLGDTEMVLKQESGPCNLVLERPFAPYPIHQLHQNEDYHILFNIGKVSLPTWNSAMLSSKLNKSSSGNGKSGFAIFSPRLLSSQGWALLSSEKDGLSRRSTNLANRISEIVGFYSDEDDMDAEWAHGSFPLEEYIKALDRAKGELYYNHSLGMQYSKITEQIYVGSCIQTPKDVKMLSETVGITAVLNFQSESERINWGINSEAINDSCRQNNILMINYPIRAAIVWATWDLIALVENGRHDGTPTHSVCFVWNNGREGEDVELVGDFTCNWKDKLKCNHKSGSRYEADVRLRHGKYYYKFIVGGNWRHSSSLPSETDEHGNVNNVIRVGDIARIRPAPSQLQIKDPSVVKVIERALTEDERFSLAFAARLMAFAICPIRLSPKQ